MHVVRALVVSCALVTCQCELRSGECVIVSEECLLRRNAVLNTLPFKVIKTRCESSAKQRYFRILNVIFKASVSLNMMFY